MWISADASEHDLEPALYWLGGFIGAAVDKRIMAYERRERANPLLTSHFRNNFPLEFAFAEARRYKKNTGRFPKWDDCYLLYNFALSACRIHAQLPPAAVAGFEGALRGTLSDENGLRPFAYELGIATHLMQRGWDVKFADRCGEVRFDFLARLDAVEIEVECKTTSGDTGRKIHRKDVNRLADLILSSIAQLSTYSGCHLLRVTVPGRLPSQERALGEIASAIASACDNRISCARDIAQVNYRHVNIHDWPEPSRDRSTSVFFENLLELNNSNLLFYSRPRYSIVVVAINSAKSDTVINAVAEQVKYAADQCSGTRPAVIAMQMADQIAITELETLLTTPNGLHAIARSVFKGSKDRSHIDSIAFTIPPILAIGSSRVSGSVLTLFNDTSRFNCAEARSLFRA